MGNLSVKTGEKKTQTKSSASVSRVITNPFPLSTPSPVDPHYSYHPTQHTPKKKEKEKDQKTHESRKESTGM